MGPDKATRTWLSGLGLGGPALDVLAGHCQIPAFAGALRDFQTRRDAAFRVLAIDCTPHGFTCLEADKPGLRALLTVIGAGPRFPNLRVLLEGLLGAHGLVRDEGSDAFLEGALARDLLADPVVLETVAQGVPPTEARPPGVELRVRPFSRTPSYARDEADNIDYFHANLFQNVVTGQHVADSVPASPGIPGRDIYGRSLEPAEVRATPVQCGSGIALDEATGRYHALCAGFLVFEDHKLRMEPVYTIEGDVDLNTGHVNFVSDVVVKRDVRPDFSVRAGGGLRVCGSVCGGAVLSAEKDVAIELGVLGSGRNIVKAGGSLAAKFVNEALCEVGGDITLGSEALNSRLFALGRVVAPAAVVIGGRIAAVKSIDLGVVGSEVGVRTEIFLGEDHRDLTRTEKLRESIAALRERAQAQLARHEPDVGAWQEPREWTAGLNAEELEALAAGLAGFLNLLNDLHLAVQEYKLMNTKTPEGREPLCRVHRTVHPGTVFHSLGSMLEIKETVRGPVEILEHRESADRAWLTLRRLPR